MPPRVHGRHPLVRRVVAVLFMLTAHSGMQRSDGDLDDPELLHTGHVRGEDQRCSDREPEPRPRVDLER